MKLIRNGLLTGLLVSSLNAATVSWTASILTTSGTNGQTVDASNFDTSGTFVRAITFGLGTDTIGTINFANGGTPSGFRNYEGKHPGGGSPLTNNIVYALNAGVDAMTIDGLVIGNTYRLQVVSFDAETRDPATVAIDGGTTRYDHSNGTYTAGNVLINAGTGILFTGIFTADATTQSYTIDGKWNPTTVAASEYSGYTLYQIPEPTTALLGSIGVVALLRRRRA